MGKPTYVLILNKGFHFLPPCSLTCKVPPLPQYLPYSHMSGSCGQGHTHPIVKNYKGAEILPHLQANNEVNHSFMDASRRHDTLGSDTKTLLLTVKQAARASAHSVLVPQTPVPTGQHKEGQ